MTRQRFTLSPTGPGPLAPDRGVALTCAVIALTFIATGAGMLEGHAVYPSWLDLAAFDGLAGYHADYGRALLPWLPLPLALATIGTAIMMVRRPAAVPRRAGFAAGDHLAPRLAAREAVNLWFRVPRRPMPPPSTEPPGGRLKVLTGEHGSLRTISWGTGPVVCFVYGWGGSAEQVNGLTEPLTRSGFQVVTFDAPGYGRSPIGESGRTNAVDAGRALRAVGAE